MRVTTRTIASGIWLALGALSIATALVSSCSQGSTGPAGPPGGGTTDTVLKREEDAPGVIVSVIGISGASGSTGFFNAGDPITVTYSLKKRDGSAWNLGEMSFANALVSGPTFNYQRVIGEQTDVAARSVANGDGSFSYTFASRIPASYLPPLNDSPSFGGDAGEMSGSPLAQGTYTVGLTFAWSYTVGGRAFRDVGETTADFRLGGSAVLTHREVSKQSNCNQCHVTLQAHDGLHRDFTLCLLCHTAGAEDLNDPAVASGTPDVTVNSRVMFHKIHNGAHLPSVVGVAVRTTPPSQGMLDYDAAPKPYVIATPGGVVRDFSDVGFPVWPNRTIPMPRDLRYASLSSSAKAREDQINRGITKCDVCHGDPDGPGPLTAPQQGNTAYASPSRAACGACHDDIVWTSSYIVNDASISPPPTGMVPQLSDATCRECHEPDGFQLSVRGGHLHPLNDPTFNTGVNFDITSLSEAGASNGDGDVDPGEKVAITFTIRNDAGMNLSPSTLGAIRAVISGPTSNGNLLLEASIPKAIFTNLTQPYTINVPELRQLELAGHSTAAPGEVFATSAAPHLNVAGAPTSVLVRSATLGGSTTLAASAAAPQNFIEVADATGFSRNDDIVIDDGIPGSEEYLRVQFVDGERLWFSSPESPAYAPGLRVDHPAGAAVLAVTLDTKIDGVDYDLDEALGSITELTEFGAGNAVLVTYTTDFVMPARYPLAANASPDLDESSGKWTGKSLASGTYRIALSTSFESDFFIPGQATTYRIGSPPAARDFLVGSAVIDEPYALISSGSNCLACHQDIWYHDAAWRGFDDCIVCHGNAGAEDRPRYVAANAPETAGVTVNFRTLLHEIHMGKRLTNASTFTVVGSASRNYPNNYTAKTYERILFPAMPGATMHCAKCHGDANDAWMSPTDRNHPSEQVDAVRAWKWACGTCHDSSAAEAHIEANTTSRGEESCAVCHGPGRTFNVAVVHKTR